MIVMVENTLIFSYCWPPKGKSDVLLFDEGKRSCNIQASAHCSPGNHSYAKYFDISPLSGKKGNLQTSMPC